jgi:hypothetical protein
MGNKTVEKKKPEKISMFGDSSMKDILFQKIYKNQIYSISENDDHRRALTGQVYQFILQITKQVLLHLKNEKNSEATEKILKKLETSKELKNQIQKIWTKEFFENFQKDEALKDCHSFLTVESLKRISELNYIPSSEDIKFCFESPFFKTNSYNDTFEYEFIYTGEHVESMNEKTDFVIFLVSLSMDENEMKKFLITLQNRNLNPYLNNVPIIFIYKGDDSFKSLLLKKKIPSFIGNLLTLKWIVSEECYKRDHMLLEKFYGENIFKIDFKFRRLIDSIWHILHSKQSKSNSKLNVLLLGTGEVGKTLKLS